MTADTDKKIKQLEDRIAKLEKFLEPQFQAKEDLDKLSEKAIEIVKRYKDVSASLLQRSLAIGYSRAARLLDILEEKGYVGHAEGGKPRKVLKKISPSPQLK
jgi:S-DNA-T family DNA segregation ATPase FtsK/SpoIIIE